MFGQILYVQWKWNRDFLAFYTAVGFAAPLIVIWIALPHMGLTSPGELVSVGGAIGAVCGGIAALAGMSVAWQGYNVDDRLGHIYSLSLPITRIRGLWLRAVTASATLMIPALGIWIGGLIAAGQMDAPAPLESYAGSLAIRPGPFSADSLEHDVDVSETSLELRRIEILDSRAEKKPWQMREERVSRRAGIEEEATPEFATPSVRHQIRIESVEQALAPGRTWLAKTESPHLYFLEEIVSEE